MNQNVESQLLDAETRLQDLTRDVEHLDEEMKQWLTEKEGASAVLPISEFVEETVGEYSAAKTKSDAISSILERYALRSPESISKLKAWIDRRKNLEGKIIAVKEQVNLLQIKKSVLI